MKKSNLSVVQTFPTQQRPPAPAGLSPDEAAEWRALVACMPATWFPRECHAALAALCRHTVRARVIGGRITEVQAKALNTEEGIRVLDRMLAMLERETRQITSLSRAMRLTQQTRVNKVVAAARAANTGASFYDLAQEEDDDGEDL
jgi:hypothetical protein